MKRFAPKNMIHVFAAASLGLVSFLVAVPNSADASYSQNSITIARSGTKTLAEIAASNSSFSTLTKLLKHLEVVEILNNPNSEPYTVFAPTDAAFAALPEGMIETLLKPENKDTLRKIMAYHVLAGTRTSSDLSSKRYRAATTENLFLNVQVGRSGVKVNTSKVLQADIVASNGVIHVVDQVLIPQ